MFITDVPGLIVNTGVVLFAVQLLEIFTTDEPKLRTLLEDVLQVLGGDELNDVHVQVVPLVFNVPSCKLMLLKVLLAFKLTIAPTPFIVIPALVPEDVA
jgi:hypothetical protein